VNADRPCVRVPGGVVERRWSAVTRRWVSTRAASLCRVRWRLA